MAIDKNKLEVEACVNRFYKIVLSWDYLRILKESDKRIFDKKTGASSGVVLKEVANTYKDVDEYTDTWEPLIFEEVKAQIAQGKDEEEDTPWQLVSVTEYSEINGFHLPVVVCTDAESISQNDLLIISKKKFGEGKALPTTYAFALVEHRQQDKIRLRLYLDGEFKRYNTDDVQPCARLSRLVNEVKKVSVAKDAPEFLYILKICSLSTIVREYVGMRSLSSLPFMKLLLAGADTGHTSEDSKWIISAALNEFIKENHNETQREAIYVSPESGMPFTSTILSDTGIVRFTNARGYDYLAGSNMRFESAISYACGPPGTGKTQTILGILSAILHATPARVHSNKEKLAGLNRGPELPVQEKYNHWNKASPWLSGINPRDIIMPRNGDDGFFPTSGNEMKPEMVNSSRKYRVRVLVCAPSNSALDEIVLRILNTGIRDENGRAYSPKIVRIGLRPHHSVQAVSMDYLVEQKLAGVDSQVGDKQKQQGGVAKDKDSIRASILDEAVIVFSTLSFSGSPLFSKLNRGFDVVIIDEAAQAVEPATLVPLANGCKQVVLVGDPVQLPATVISTVAEKFGYGMSLFKRLQKAGHTVHMLKTQYRMHPEIRSFPSKEFYEGALLDGQDVTVQTTRSWHGFRCFGPFCFFDIHEAKESQPSGSGSWVNVDEVEFVLALYSKLVSRYPELKASSRLAIISPYRHQVKLFRERFRATFGVESDKVVDINTVDGFQGREKDVAIFSCVRASKDKGIGFVADFRRMNVGITRARSSVLVVGSASTLKRDGHWKNLVESAEERNTLFKVSKPYSDFFGETNLKSMEVKESIPDRVDAPEDMDVDIIADANAGIAADQGQAEDNDWGDAGGEADDGDFGGED